MKSIKRYIYLGAVRAAIIALQLANVKILVANLSLDSLGYYYFYIAIATFTSAFVFSPIDYYQQREIKFVLENTKSVWPLMIFLRSNVAIFALLVFFLYAAAELLQIRNAWLFMLSLILSAMMYVVLSFRNTLNNYGLVEFVSRTYLYETALKLAATSGISYFLSLSPAAALLIWISSLAATALTLLFRFHRESMLRKVNDVRLSLRELLKVSPPITANAMANWVVQDGYKVLLTRLGYLELMAVYSTLSNLGATGFNALAMVYSQSNTPKIYKTNGAYTGKFILGALVLTAGAIFGALLLGQFLVPLLLTSSFEAHWYLIVFGVLVSSSNLTKGAMFIKSTFKGLSRLIWMSTIASIALISVSGALAYISDAFSYIFLGGSLSIASWIPVAVLYFGANRLEKEA